MWSVAALGLVVGSHAALAASTGEASAPNRRVFCTNWSDDTCSLVDVDAGTELAVINVGLKPYDVKIRDGLAYVTNSGESTVSIVDLGALAEVGKIAVGGNPRDLAITKNGARAVVANSGSDSISVVSLSSRSEVYTVAVGSIPYGVALFNNDTQAVVTNWGDGTASIVDLGANSGQVVKTLPIGSLPYTVTISGTEGAAYITVFGEHKVVPIDLTSFTTGTAIPVARSPWGIATSPDGTYGVVAGFYDGIISIIDYDDSSPSFGTESNQINVGEMNGTEVARAAAAKHAAVLAAAQTVVGDLAVNQLVLVDLSTDSVIRRINVGSAPYGIALVPPSSGS